MCVIRFLLFCMFFLSGVIVNSGEKHGQLIRPTYVYKNVIRGVHDYFNNTCILLLHATPDPIETQEPDRGEALLELQVYLSSEVRVRTAIMDLQMFIDRVGSSYFHIKRPLFVLLNDYDDLRKQFAQVSTWITMAYPTWLLFMRDETEIMDFLSDVYVPFDCVFLVAKEDTWIGGEIIRDVYRIHKEDELRSMTFGSWTKERGLWGPSTGLYQRRADLNGLSLRVVTIHDPPVAVIIRNEQNQLISLDGFFGKVLDLLEEGMNCKFELIETSSWGIQLPNGSWTGALRMLIDGEADLAAMELIMTSDRLDAIQFTTPVYSTKCRTYIKRPESRAVKWNAYLAPFNKHIWNGLAILIILATSAIAIIESTVNRIAEIPRPEDTTPTRVTEILFYVFGAFCNQGMEPSLLDPIRLVHLSVHLTAVIVLAAYSAALISFLAVKTFIMPFTTMEGLLKDGTYRFAVISDSADYTFFQNTSDKILSVMFDELLARETDLPLNYLDGLARICREENYAFMTLDNMAGVLQDQVQCTLEALDVMMQITVAMAVPNQSPYKGIIDANILLLRDSGILQRLLQAEWTVNNNRAQSTWTSVEIEDVLPLILFLLIALFITCMVLMMERAAFYRVQEQHRKRADVSDLCTVNSVYLDPKEEGTEQLTDTNHKNMERNSSRMSNIGCKVSATRRSILKKDIGSSVGKENNPLLLKKSFLAKAPTISCAENRGYEENPPKRRLSLGQGELKREDSRSALTNIKVNAKKAPFFVHCDEKNEKKQIEQKETRLDSRRISVSKPGKSQKSNSEHVSKIPVRKPPGLVRSQSLNPLREIVPLKATRSSSADVPSIKSRVPKISQTKITLPAKTITTSVVTRKISKVASKVESKEVQVANASSKPVIGSKRPLSSLRLRTGRESVFKRHVSVTCEVEKNNTTSNSKDIKGKRVSDILEAKSDEESMSTISHPKETQDSGIAEMSRNSRSGGENLESKLDRRGSLQQENVRYLLGSVITPVDGPPPAPLMPVKVLVKKAKEIAAETTRKQLKRQDTIAGESCPIELAYHMEYQYDLLKIEKEREERAPQLSEYFLRRHINAQQRKDIVAYLIHLGVHCRYPSFVIYQTVKLFDIAMDRLSVGIERIQLTALAALWICLKRLEVYRKIPSAATIIALAKEMYVGQEELLMVYERKVLQAVDFNISFSDAFSLLAHYIINCKHQVDIPADTTDLIYKYGGYMIDLTMLDERFCRPPASLVAFVVAELAMVLVQDTMASVLALKTRWRYSSIVTDTQLLDSPEREDVKEVNGLRAAIIRSIRDSGNKRSGYDIVYKKYNRSRYGCISRSLVERAKRLPSLDTVDY